MSAYVVDHDHIDAILTVATGWNVDCRWVTGEDIDEQDWRSHVYRGIGYGTGRSELTPVGRMLLTENVRSVAYRYPGCDADQLPGSIGQTVDGYEFRRVPYPEYDFGPVDGLSLLSCYEYQSCEHPDWRRSEAWRFCQSLRSALISVLPGYDAAPHHFLRREVTA